MKRFSFRLTLALLALVQSVCLLEIKRVTAVPPADPSRDQLVDPYVITWAIALLVSIILALVYGALLVRKKARFDPWVLALLLLSAVAYLLFSHVQLHAGGP